MTGAALTDAQVAEAVAWFLANPAAVDYIGADDPDLHADDHARTIVKAAVAGALEVDRLRAELAETRAERDYMCGVAGTEANAKIDAMVTADVWKMRADRLATVGDALVDGLDQIGGWDPEGIGGLITGWRSVRGDAPAPAEPLHEWRCPGCGTTTRARMADAPAEPPADEPRAILPHDWARREVLFLAREVVQYRGSQLERAKLDQLAEAITTLDEKVAEYRAARLTAAPADDTAAPDPLADVEIGDDDPIGPYEPAAICGATAYTGHRAGRMECLRGPHPKGWLHVSACDDQVDYVWRDLRVDELPGLVMTSEGVVCRVCNLEATTSGGHVTGCTGSGRDGGDRG